MLECYTFVSILIGQQTGSCEHLTNFSKWIRRIAKLEEMDWSNFFGTLLLLLYHYHTTTTITIIFMMRPLATIENIAGSVVSKQSIFLASIRYFSSRPWYR